MDRVEHPAAASVTSPAHSPTDAPSERQTYAVTNPGFRATFRHPLPPEAV